MFPKSDLTDITAKLQGLERLVSPFGLVSRTAALPVREGEPQFAVDLAYLGIPSRALDNLKTWHRDEDVGNADGAGTGLNGERSRLIAIAEALERYSTCSWSDDDFVMSAEDDLEVEAVSPARWPQCSADELAKEGSTLLPYDSSVPIRWSRAWSLTRNCEVLVPAISVYLHMPYESSAERFTRGITTGAAVHSDIRTAVLNGLSEVVERDAIALVWLQMLGLSPIEIEAEKLDPVSREHYRIGNSTELNVRLFNATTDFGIPVIYAVQLSESDPLLAQVVAATCDVDPERALAKIYRELASLRVALRGYLSTYVGREISSAQVSVVGGAVFNGAINRRGIFDFLLNSKSTVQTLDDLPRIPEGSDPLKTAVDRLAARGAEVLVVDITTDEARQVGMHAVKVLVPEAMPVSFVHGERYLGTRRLYDAPRAMGYAVRPEAAVNNEFQPFA